MAQTIENGALVIKVGANLPDGLRFESEPYLKDWKLVKNLDGSGMGRKVSEVGWAFFYMAGEVQGVAFGSDSEATTRRAVKKAIANMESEKFNCLEISGVVRKKGFLGLPSTTVTGHARHIQNSLYLFHHEQISERDQTNLAAIAPEVRL